MWSNLTSTLRRDLTDLVGQIKNDAVTVVTAIDEAYKGAVHTAHQGTRSKRPVGAAVKALRADAATYTEDVAADEAKEFEQFCSGLEVDSAALEDEMEDMLDEDEAMLALYEKLVPEAMTHDLFWQRFFYRLHKLEATRGDAVLAAVSRAQAEEDSLNWGDDDEEPPPPQQRSAAGQQQQQQRAAEEPQQQQGSGAAQQQEHSVEQAGGGAATADELGRPAAAANAAGGRGVEEEEEAPGAEAGDDVEVEVEVTLAAAGRTAEEGGGCVRASAAASEQGQATRPSRLRSPVRAAAGESPSSTVEVAVRAPDEAEGGRAAALTDASELRRLQRLLASMEAAARAAEERHSSELEKPCEEAHERVREGARRLQAELAAARQDAADAKGHVQALTAERDQLLAEVSRLSALCAAAAGGAAAAVTAPAAAAGDAARTAALSADGPPTQQATERPPNSGGSMRSSCDSLASSSVLISPVGASTAVAQRAVAAAGGAAHVGSSGDTEDDDDWGV